MSSKKVVSFFIVALAVLCVSAIITVALVFSGQKITAPESIVAYSFNFYETNNSNIRERSSSKLTLAESVVFKPTQATEWNDNYVSYKETASDGVDYAITKYAKYVCAIPFTAKNGGTVDKHFKIDLSSDGMITATSIELKNSLIVKIYCYETETYYTEAEFNSANLEAIAGQVYNFCLVAVSNEANCEGVNFGTDKANINFNISIV